METRILHGSQKFDPLVTEEKKLTDAGQKAITITHLEQSSVELKMVLVLKTDFC